MRNVIFAAVLMAALLGSGCLAAGNGTTSNDAGAIDKARTEIQAMGPAVHFASCREHDVVMPIPMQDAAAGLPDGFTPASFDSQGATAAVLIFTTHCMEGAAGDHPLMSPAEMWGFLAVNPPDQFKSASVDGYLFTYGAFEADPAAAQMYHHWGIPAANVTVGSVSLEVTTALGAPGAIGQADGSDANFTVSTMSSSGGAIYWGSGGRLREFFVDAHGELGAMDTTYLPYNSWSEAGPAVVTMGAPGAMGLPADAATASGGAGLGYMYWNFGYETRLVPLTHEVAPPPAAAATGEAFSIRAFHTA
jgi:hypothetical protein